MKAIFPLFFLFGTLHLAVTQRSPVPNLPYIDQEEAGFIVDSLVALQTKIANTEHKDFTGLVVIKDHQLAIEWYYNTFWRNQILDIRSAGKSITSLLLGVAIQEGLIESLDQDVYSFFPKENTDSYGMFWYKKQRTIKGKTFDYLWASGRGGNQLIVIPEENMVIALTATAYGQEAL